MARTSGPLALCALLAVLCQPAAADLLSAADPNGIAQALRERGQSVIVTVDAFGDPFIETSVDNVDYSVFFYGCTDHRGCTSLSFRAQRTGTGSLSPDAMNDWNVDQRWTKLYTAEVNAAVMEMDLLFAGEGMSARLFGAYLAIWTRSLEQFVRYVDGEPYDFVEE